MKRIILLATVIFGVGVSAFAEEVTRVSATTSLGLDLRTGTREKDMDTPETIRWSGLWAGDADSKVVLMINDERVVNGSTGEGDYVWSERTPGTYTLKLLTYKGNLLVNRLEATFVIPNTTSAGIPFKWLEDNGFVFPGALRTEYEAAANGDFDGDGYPEWKEYIIGTNPFDKNDYGFTVDIRMDAEGMPVLTWNPDLNEGGTKAERDYIVEVSDTPDGPWTEVEGTDSDNGRIMPSDGSGIKLYKVKIQLP